jgi:outer membrane protein OmpA-like peptidoglycan-associated protein
MLRSRAGMALFALASTLSFLAMASAQTAGQFPSANLVFPSSDLTFPVADLRFPVRLDVRETAQEVRIELAADVLFDFDKADIRTDAAAALAEAAELIRQKSRGPVRVEGHTDSKGGDTYNQKLSERRAAAVAGWLKGHAGLKSTEFRTAGFGARQPVAPNQMPDGSDDPEGRQKNRRVSLVIQK